MRQFRHYALLALLFVSGASLLTIPAQACVVGSMPIRVQPTLSVHVYNDLGPVKGLKLKLVTLGDENPLAEATTDDKGTAVFQLQKLRGSDLFLQPEHNVIGWQWPELYIEPDAAKSSIEISWPSQVLRSRNLRGTIQTQDHADASQVFPLIRASLSIRSLVSYEEIATAVTDEKGAFQFAEIKPGLYYLQVNGKYKNHPTVPQGDIAVFIGSTEANESLSIITRYSDCGLDYPVGAGNSSITGETSPLHSMTGVLSAMTGFLRSAGLLPKGTGDARIPFASRSCQRASSVQHRQYAERYRRCVRNPRAQV